MNWAWFPLFTKGRMKELLVPFVSFIASLFFVILFIAFGWYIVWTLFLKRFKFVRELLGTSESDTDTSEKPKRSKGKIRRD